MTEGLIKLCSDNNVDPNYVQGFIKACSDNGINPDDLVKDAQFWTEMKRMGRDIGNWGKEKWDSMGALGKGITGGAAAGGAVGGLPGAMLGGTIGGLAGGYKSLLNSAGDARGDIKQQFGGQVQGGFNQAQADRRGAGLHRANFNAMAVPDRIRQFGTRNYSQAFPQQGQAGLGNYNAQNAGFAGMQAGGASTPGPGGAMTGMAGRMGQATSQVQNQPQQQPSGYYGQNQSYGNPYMY